MFVGDKLRILNLVGLMGLVGRIGCVRIMGSSGRCWASRFAFLRSYSRCDPSNARYSTTRNL